MYVFFFFFKQKTAYEITRWLEFRRVLFRSGFWCISAWIWAINFLLMHVIERCAAVNKNAPMFIICTHYGTVGHCIIYRYHCNDTSLLVCSLIDLDKTLLTEIPLNFVLGFWGRGNKFWLDTSIMRLYVCVEVCWHKAEGFLLMAAKSYHIYWETWKHEIMKTLWKTVLLKAKQRKLL